MGDYKSNYFGQDFDDAVAWIKSNATRVLQQITSLTAKVGDLSKLLTKNKTSAVDAINEIYTQGGGSGRVDTEMSDTSTNAVQNNVIKSYVDSAFDKTNILNVRMQDEVDSHFDNYSVVNIMDGVDVVATILMNTHSGLHGMKGIIFQHGSGWRIVTEDIGDIIGAGWSQVLEDMDSNSTPIGEGGSGKEGLPSGQLCLDISHIVKTSTQNNFAVIGDFFYFLRSNYLIKADKNMNIVYEYYCGAYPSLTRDANEWIVKSGDVVYFNVGKNSKMIAALDESTMEYKEFDSVAGITFYAKVRLFHDYILVIPTYLVSNVLLIYSKEGKLMKDLRKVSVINIPFNEDVTETLMDNKGNRLDEISLEFGTTNPFPISPVIACFDIEWSGYKKILLTTEQIYGFAIRAWNEGGSTTSNVVRTGTCGNSLKVLLADGNRLVWIEKNGSAGVGVYTAPYGIGNATSQSFKYNSCYGKIYSGTIRNNILYILNQKNQLIIDYDIAR